MSNQQEQNNQIKDNNILSQSQNAEAVKSSGSPLNSVLWILGLGSLVGATLINQYLPAYWQPASSIWVRIGAIAAAVVLGVVLLLLTQQGRGFSKLLKDTQVELRRVTWPTKDETIEYTWKVLVVIIISGILIYFLDGMSSIFVSPFIK